MARENLAFLRASVAKAPTIIKKDDIYQYALVFVNVARGLRKVGDHRKYMKTDYVPVMTRDEDCMMELEKWKEHDIVDIKGVIATKRINKSSYCECGCKNSYPGTMVFVEAIFAERITHLDSDEECLKYLTEHREISNQAFLFGTLCRDPKKITPKQGLIVTQYQIAMNRKYRIPLDPPEIKSDYPWVKSYGENAVNDKKRLHVGSEVFIDGCIQTRAVERHAICGAELGEDGKPLKDENGNPILKLDKDGAPIGCGTEYTWKDRALEIVPYETEYIGDFYSDEEVEQNEKDRLAQKTRDIQARQKLDLREFLTDEEDGPDDKLSQEDYDAGFDDMKTGTNV